MRTEALLEILDEYLKEKEQKTQSKPRQPRSKNQRKRKEKEHHIQLIEEGKILEALEYM